MATLLNEFFFREKFLPPHFAAGVRGGCDNATANGCFAKKSLLAAEDAKEKTDVGLLLRDGVSLCYYVVGRWGSEVCLAEIADDVGSLLGIGKAFAGIGAAEAEDTEPFYAVHVDDVLLSRRTGPDTDLECIWLALRAKMSSIASLRMSTFHHSREFSADPARVYQACSDPALLAQWWGPEGFTNTFAVFEFYPGGKWLFTMHGPDGTDYPNESEFLEIVPEKLIRIKHVNLPHFVSSMSFAASENGTRVTWDCEFENAAFAVKMRGFLEQANEQNLDRLTAVVREITCKRSE